MRNVPTWNEKSLTDFAAVAFQCEKVAAEHFMHTTLSNTFFEGVKPVHLARGHESHRAALASLLNDVAKKYFNSPASKQKVAKFWENEHIPN
ncbi:MAG: hypothetical protein AAF182_01055 [Pseudomonadota bacterium]